MAPLSRSGRGAGGEGRRWSAYCRSRECALSVAVEGINRDGARLTVEIDLECGGGFDARGFYWSRFKCEDVTIPMVKGIDERGWADGQIQRVVFDRYLHRAKVVVLVLPGISIERKGCLRVFGWRGKLRDVGGICRSESVEGVVPEFKPVTRYGAQVDEIEKAVGDSFRHTSRESVGQHDDAELLGREQLDERSRSDRKCT